MRQYALLTERVRGGARAAAQLAGYLACLAIAFAGAVGFLQLVGPDAPAATTAASAAPSPAPSAEPSAVPSPRPVAYTLALDRTDLPYGGTEYLRLQVLEPGGNPVPAAAGPDGEFRLAIVRADLGSYQDLRAEPAGPGAWRVPVALPPPGPYRLLCELRLPGMAAPVDLSAGLVAAGDYLPVTLDAPATTAATRQYVITMAGEPAVGEEVELAFTVTEAGPPLTDLLPLDGRSVGALAALRAHDMARGQVAPRTLVPPGGTAGPEMRFGVLFPGVGTYRLFLDFQRAGGRRHTVAYTVAVPE